MLGAIQVTARYPLAIGSLTLVSRNHHSSNERIDSPLLLGTHRRGAISSDVANVATGSRSRFRQHRRHGGGVDEKEEYRLPPPPEEWRQRPLYVRATPGSKTRILRIRRVGKKTIDDGDDASIPINNGMEAPGESALIDFESDHFVGTLLLLLRGAPSMTNTSAATDNNDGDPSHPRRDFFGERKETWHGVVRGRFKQPHELQTCVTGQIFRRPAGRLLPHWLMHRLVMPLINRLAPHNAIDLECQQPYYWAPMAHMSQTVLVSSNEPSTTALPTAEDMEHELDRTEPHGSTPQSIIHEIAMMKEGESLLRGSGNLNLIKRLTKRLSNRLQPSLPPPNANPNANLKARKNFLKQYFDEGNDNTTKSSKRVYWSPDKEYTFGIYNHWVIFNDPNRGNEIALDLRLPFCHHIPLPTCTDGQPIVFMSGILPEEQGDADEKDPTKLQYLWSFEIWHESLYPAAKQHHDNELIESTS